MNWPTAAVIIGCIASIVPIIIKFVPSRNKDSGVKGGVSHEDIDHKIESLEKKIDDRFVNLNERIDNIIMKIK